MARRKNIDMLRVHCILSVAHDSLIENVLLLPRKIIIFDKVYKNTYKLVYWHMQNQIRSLSNIFSCWIKKLSYCCKGVLIQRWPGCVSGWPRKVYSSRFVVCMWPKEPNCYLDPISSEFRYFTLTVHGRVVSCRTLDSKNPKARSGSWDGEASPWHAQADQHPVLMIQRHRRDDDQPLETTGRIMWRQIYRYPVHVCSAGRRGKESCGRSGPGQANRRALRSRAAQRVTSGGARGRTQTRRSGTGQGCPGDTRDTLVSLSFLPLPRRTLLLPRGTRNQHRICRSPIASRVLFSYARLRCS
jgi:hypothetical protein